MKSFYFLWISRTLTLPLLSSSLTGSEWWTRMKTMIIKNEYLLQSVCWWEITVLLWISRSTSVWPKAWSVESILGGGRDSCSFGHTGTSDPCCFYYITLLSSIIFSLLEFFSTKQQCTVQILYSICFGNTVFPPHSKLVSKWNRPSCHLSIFESPVQQFT